jgi:hypothetical protein
MARRFPELQAQRLHGRGAHCFRVLWRRNRSKLQLEALALGVVAHGAVSVTVRRIARPDRNWNWELASINWRRPDEQSCRFSSPSISRTRRAGSRGS